MQFAWKSLICADPWLLWKALMQNRRLESQSVARSEGQKPYGKYKKTQGTSGQESTRLHGQQSSPLRVTGLRPKQSCGGCEVDQETPMVGKWASFHGYPFCTFGNLGPFPVGFREGRRKKTQINSLRGKSKECIDWRGKMIPVEKFNAEMGIMNRILPWMVRRIMSTEQWSVVCVRTPQLEGDLDEKNSPCSKARGWRDGSVRGSTGHPSRGPRHLPVPQDSLVALTTLKRVLTSHRMDWVVGCLPSTWNHGFNTQHSHKEKQKNSSEWRP